MSSSDFMTLVCFVDEFIKCFDFEQLLKKIVLKFRVNNLSDVNLINLSVSVISVSMSISDVS